MTIPETRASLILRLSDPADHSAWDEFVQIYEPMLFRLASRYGMQEADAREVVQETLIAVSRAVPRFSTDGSAGAFRGWLATIARNKLADHLAKRSKQVRGTGDTGVHQWLDQQACQESCASVWDWQQKQQIFTWAANKVRLQVSDATWQAFDRTCVQGQSVRLVAREIGISEGMIYVARSRVMSRLRKAVTLWIQQESEADS